MTRPTLIVRTFGAVLLCLALAGSSQGLAQKVSRERDDVWAQSYTDIKADPDVRFGVLPNGMRYALMHNGTPARQVSLRFAMHAGSVNETDAQQGLAHFLEHMAFKGSKNNPEGMVKVLERLGLAFGADTNANTGWDYTTYQLDLPDAGTLDTGLMLMRETASNLTLDAKAMEPERGVVLSEERVRDTPEYRASISNMKYYLGNLIATRRIPIGKVEVLQHAPVSEIAKFYRTNYRPERATLIVVGDIDVNMVEAKIKAQFADWKSTTPKPAAIKYGAPTKKTSRVAMIVEPSVSTDVSIDWVNAYDASADTAAIRKRDTIRGIALGIVNQRLTHLAQAPQPPFQRAEVSRNNYLHSAEIAELSVTSQPENWKTALVAAENIRRQALQFGVRQDEIDRQIIDGRNALQNSVAGAATRRSPQLAGQLAGAAEGNSVFTSPTQRQAQFEQSVKGLTVAQVNAALKSVFVGEGPLLVYTGPKAADGGNAALTMALREAESTPVVAAVADENKSWTHTNFGVPGTVANRQHIDDLDADFIEFANGVRLTVKSTKYSANQISISVRIGDGLLELPKSAAGLLWATGTVTSGGLSDLTQEEIRKIFTGKSVGAGFGVGEDAFELSGGTRPEDFDTEMQLLTAYVTAPGFRPEAFERAKTSTRTALTQMDSTAGDVFGRDSSILIHDGDVRWKTPDNKDLDAAKPGDVEALLRPRLANGRIEVVIVGDTSVDRAIDAVAKTFGALPPRSQTSNVPADALVVRFPGPVATPVNRTHKGRADQGLAFIGWPTEDFMTDQQEARAVRMAEQILQNRLIDKFRVEKGLTYSPNTEYALSTVFPHYGFVAAEVETPPTNIDAFFADTQSIATDIATNGVTADDMQRARAPRIETLSRAQQSNNGYWLSALGGAQTDKRKLTLIRDTISGLQKVTTDDVKRAAAKYFLASKAWKMTVTPK